MRILKHAVLLPPFIPAGCNTTEKTQPNINLCFTDDNGFEYWGCNNGPDLSHSIDDIAARGGNRCQYIYFSFCLYTRQVFIASRKLAVKAVELNDMGKFHWYSQGCYWIPIRLP
ncbi:MAG: hypothetical protein K9J30_04475 [Bacteroidales bacterium]|nr:hypothetical protein [Bacteroidales bacterium]